MLTSHPERLGAGAEDARADIYSLACVLYECLTGRPPFDEATMAGLVAAHLNTPPPRPSTTQPNVPAQFDRVIATGMAKDPDNRYATTVELADAAHDAITEPIAPPTPNKPTLPGTERAPLPPTEQAPLPPKEQACNRVTAQPRIDPIRTTEFPLPPMPPLAPPPRRQPNLAANYQRLGLYYWARSWKVSSSASGHPSGSSISSAYSPVGLAILIAYSLSENWKATSITITSCSGAITAVSAGEHLFFCCGSLFRRRQVERCADEFTQLGVLFPKVCCCGLWLGLVMGVVARASAC
ncbi:kinase domain protein [Mycobacterium kansasii 824]|nr:kinase domain protein [Mycobacterium kansasii 824]